MSKRTLNTNSSNPLSAYDDNALSSELRRRGNAVQDWSLTDVPEPSDEGEDIEKAMSRISKAKILAARKRVFAEVKGFLENCEAGNEYLQGEWRFERNELIADHRLALKAAKVARQAAKAAAAA